MHALRSFMQICLIFIALAMVFLHFMLGTLFLITYTEQN